jgi:Mg-chelatase subunit ChlD
MGVHRRGPSSAASWLAVLLALVLHPACAGGTRVDTTDASPRGSLPASRVDGGPAATPVRSNQPGDAGPSGSARADGDACNQVELTFASRTPTVFVLVDRSSSMFERGLWDPLKAGVLDVIEQLEDDVRFGFATYTGERAGMCPELTRVATIAKGNYEAIKQAYEAVEKPSYKGETPTSLALDEVAKTLRAEPSGPKFILLVTDGEADFCDDPNVTCSRDAVVASAQAAYADGIGTFIFSVGGQVDRAHLGDVANAGSGQPVLDRQQQVTQQCQGGKASYADSSGSASFFEPDVNDRSALIGALSSVVAGVRSCVFDLTGRAQIDLAAASEGVVEIDGTRVPFAGPNGYRLNNSTEVELLGAACERLKSAEPRKVFIDFPCEAVLLL